MPAFNSQQWVEYAYPFAFSTIPQKTLELLFSDTIQPDHLKQKPSQATLKVDRNEDYSHHPDQPEEEATDEGQPRLPPISDHQTPQFTTQHKPGIDLPWRPSGGRDSKEFKAHQAHKDRWEAAQLRKKLHGNDTSRIEKQGSEEPSWNHKQRIARSCYSEFAGAWVQRTNALSTDSDDSAATSTPSPRPRKRKFGDETNPFDQLAQHHFINGPHRRVLLDPEVHYENVEKKRKRTTAMVQSHPLLHSRASPTPPRPPKKDIHSPSSLNASSSSPKPSALEKNSTSSAQRKIHGKTSLTTMTRRWTVRSASAIKRRWITTCTISVASS